MNDGKKDKRRRQERLGETEEPRAIFDMKDRAVQHGVQTVVKVGVVAARMGRRRG
jgi:hypothetical protein